MWFTNDHNLALSIKQCAFKVSPWILNTNKKTCQQPIPQYLFYSSFGNSTWFSLNNSNLGAHKKAALPLNPTLTPRHSQFRALHIPGHSRF